MGKIRKPRHGSMQYRPRQRAAKLLPRVKTWGVFEKTAPLGFGGYKVGMTHVVVVDDSVSPSAGMQVSAPCTVLEVPHMLVYGIRGYKSDYHGKKSFADGLTSDESVLKKLGLPKNDGLKKIEDNSSSLCDVSLLVAALPEKTGIGAKEPQFTEIAVGGKDANSKLDYAKTLLGKELKAADVFAEGEFVEAIAVTKGKGWQGAVKRFGVSMQRRKATNKVRHVGTLGPWHPSKVMYTVPMAGQTGFHKRTELNKRILKLGEDPKDINVPGGFKGYGVVKSAYVLVKGSVPGPRKRFVWLKKAVRSSKVVKKPDLKFVCLDSHQGA